jgi:hypothetical protein
MGNDIGVDVRFLTLFERLDAWRRNSKPPGSPSERSVANKVVERWRKAVAGADFDLFEARLRWDGFDEEDVLDALSWIPGGGNSLGPTEVGTVWIEELTVWFRSGFRRVDDGVIEVYSDWAEDLGVAFVDLWAPWIVEATEAVSRHPAIVAGRISEDALQCLSRQLLQQIGEVGSEGAYVQFNRRRSAELSALAER